MNLIDYTNIVIKLMKSGEQTAPIRARKITGLDIAGTFYIYQYSYKNQDTEFYAFCNEHEKRHQKRYTFCGHCVKNNDLVKLSAGGIQARSLYKLMQKQNQKSSR